MKKYTKVQGRSDLVRDGSNGALININKGEAAQLRQIRRNRQDKDNKLKVLENEISDIKTLLKQLIEKQDNG